MWILPIKNEVDTYVKAKQDYYQFLEKHSNSLYTFSVNPPPETKNYFM